ncbi:MAG: hypothetical protein R3310_13705 [Candidatus Competibacteraceae bacterium]|nr:hypothetical protein [Candidatus Competibacteraceae bacterium]
MIMPFIPDLSRSRAWRPIKQLHLLLLNREHCRLLLEVLAARGGA